MNIIRNSFICVTILTLVIINTVYYLTTKHNIDKYENQRIELIASNVQTSIETTMQAEGYFNELLSQELLKSSIAIKNALPPDIKDVKLEQLNLLSNQLKLKGIALLVGKNNDVIVDMSTVPDRVRVGISTKTWGKWNSMFEQLLESGNVELIPGFGEKAKHFWSGPIRNSTTDRNFITKWGFYYDKTTNYIINPFIDDDMINLFRAKAGFENTIKKTMKSNPSLLDTSVLNATILTSGETQGRDEMILFGEYNYKNEEDRILSEKALDENKMVKKLVNIDDKKVVKSYIPIEFKGSIYENHDDKFIIIISTDFEEIQKMLTGKLLFTTIVSIVCVIAGFFIMYFLIRRINRKRRTIFNLQEMYAEQMDTLHRTARENRHDANHHLYTISGLNSMGLHEDLDAYISKLLEIKIDTDDIVNINIPALSGLLQSKISEAMENRITFEHHFERFDLIQLDIMKVTNFVRIVGNILDNAFHAVMEKKEGERKVIINGRYQKGMISISIYNNGAPISLENQTKIFSHGFTTRKQKGGSGLGLSSSKKIIEMYKGKIAVTSDEEWTQFQVHLPITPKERLSK